jgi:hypothetical protein
MFWDRYLVDFETAFWSRPLGVVTVWRDSDPYQENFSFSNGRGVAFVSINHVGMTTSDASWTARRGNNLAWIQNNYDWFRVRQSQVLVIFAHAGPKVDDSSSAFYVELMNTIRDKYVDMEFVIVHRNLITETFDILRAPGGISNLSIVTVNAASWPPMRLQINVKETDPELRLQIDQESWYADVVGG